MSVVKDFEMVFVVPEFGEFPTVLRCWLAKDAYVVRYQVSGNTELFESLGLPLQQDLSRYEKQWEEVLNDLIKKLPEGTRAHLDYGWIEEWHIAASLYSGEYGLTGDFSASNGRLLYKSPDCGSPEYFLHRLIAHEGPVIRCCGTCDWNDQCIYGGTDYWQGNYCFVESGIRDRRDRWAVKEEMSDEDWDNYPALADKELLSPFFVCEKWEKSEWLHEELIMFYRNKVVERIKLP